MADRPVIEMKNVQLSLGTGPARVHILKGVSLDVSKGEALGLVGSSGSGKSTLLMTMAGLEKPDSGTVAIDGKRIDQMNEDALARFRGANIGIIFQSFHLIPTMTALENVAIPLELAGAPDAFSERPLSWRPWASTDASRIIPLNCPAASSSESLSPARWRQTLRSSSQMSPPAISTKRQVGQSSTYSSS